MARIDLLSDLRLETPRFTLSPLGDSDRDDLFAHLSDPAVTEYMDIDPLANAEAAGEILAWARKLRTDGLGVRWAIRDSNRVFVGTAGFNAIVRERAARGEIAFDVVHARWRNGVGSEVLSTLLPFGFGALGLHRIEAMVTPGNVGSCALLESQGFSLEGTLKGYAFWKNRYWDQHIYARLP